MKELIINEKDNVVVVMEEGGVPVGHKAARVPIKKGGYIIKYGHIIGRATEDIARGEWVHTHNMRTCLDEERAFVYEKQESSLPKAEDAYFYGYPNANGYGVRKYIYVIPTVGCVNGVAKTIAEMANRENGGRADNIFALTHQFGCSQLGEDAENIKILLCDIAQNPNAAFTLFVGLGCENNTLSGIKKELEPYDKGQFAYMSCQEVGDEIEYGLNIVRDFLDKAAEIKRGKVSFSRLAVGLKCGGSDAFSGITANPLVGKVSDRLVALGASVVLTEIPEMFGAEQPVLNKCCDIGTFGKLNGLIEDFKDYYRKNNMPIYENPSPGNKAGGITTLEEKSLGCVLKGGSSPVVDVLKYGDRISKQGLSVLAAPGNDLIASTALAACGCSVILFTTGRGTPFSTCVPTLKIASNGRLAEGKSNWIDFSAASMDEDGLFDLIIRTANGEYICKSENYAEIAFDKRGVTL
ncbi:MAG: altronate dehydratase [Clostridiales bacterium]|nr:altronate dehydratase [Clostridiales bacterium]